MILRKKWFLILISAAIIITVKQQFQKVIPPSFSIEKLAEQGNFPYGAVAYLKANPIEGRMFNEYNWGGFLIWQYPEKKVFIDGRMPSWRIGHYKAFEEFNEITEFGEGWGEILNSYGVKFAIVYNNSLNQTVFNKLGWQNVYSDGTSVIFKNPDY